MVIAVLKETRPNETRVSLVPAQVKSIINEGHKVLIESGAGENSFFSDELYEKQNANIVSRSEALQADLILQINPISENDIDQMKDQSNYMGFFYPHQNPLLLDKFNSKKIRIWAMNAIPRISRAQSMDALSSQANLAGYKAVIIGAEALPKIFPMLMTAAGTISPVKVLIFGAGVAGLQAIATAKRLGAVVEVSDVRPETKEQVESLGAKFISVEGMDQVKTEGGYTKELGDDFLKKQQETILNHLKQADLVITTAQIPGKNAPLIISKNMISVMKAGSVIVDMAVDSGGNCEGSIADHNVFINKVQIIGKSNLPASMPQNASELYSKNIYNLLKHLTKDLNFHLDFNDEITNGTLINKN